MNKEDKLNLFANNLRKARENTGLSKPEAAKKLNIKPAQYYRYESASAEPGILMAIEIAKLFKVPTKELFSGIESDISKADYIINTLRGYGIKADKIEGRTDRILVQFKQFPRLCDVSVALMERVIAVAEDKTKQVMQDCIPQAFFKVFFDSIDRDAVAKHIQDSFANLKEGVDYIPDNSNDDANTVAAEPPDRNIESPQSEQTGATYF